MRSIRLTEEMEQELTALASQKNVSKSEIIKEALELYMAKESLYNKPFETGGAFFGKYGSGRPDNSETYKTRLKEKLRAKHGKV